MRRLRAAHAKLSSDGCTLCGGPPGFIGFWVPQPAVQRQLLTAPSKNKVIGYALCPHCLRSPNFLARIEREILERCGEVRATSDVN